MRKHGSTQEKKINYRDQLEIDSDIGFTRVYKKKVLIMSKNKGGIESRKNGTTKMNQLYVHDI